MQFLDTLQTQNLRGKVCLLRLDLNIENLKESFRLGAALPTISWLTQKKAITLILSHRGRPPKNASSGDRRFTLKIVVPFLKARLRKPVTFISEFNIPVIQKQLRVAKPGSVFLLENLRFLPGEEGNDTGLGRELSSLGDFYVNDAFSVSHRANASVTRLPKFLPAYGGFLLKKEIVNLSRVLRHYQKPLIVVLGGAKVSDKLDLIKNFLKRADWFLVGGAIANTFLKGKGFDVGASLYEPKMIPVVKKLFRSKKMILPIDFVSDRSRFVDIGPLTVENFTEKIKIARTIVWNGPMGFFENPRWAHGSNAILKAIMKARAISVIGGGETTELVNGLRAHEKLGFVSTGGGAMLAFLGGKKMPGLEALKKSRELAP